MTAVEKTASFEGGSIAGGASKAGVGTVFGIYKATKANAADWVVFSDFTDVIGCIAINASIDPINISNNNKCTGSAGTGVTTYFVWGTPAVK